MYSTRISDHDLLPISQQVQRFAAVKGEDMTAEVCDKLKQRLNWEFEHQKISVMEYIALSKKVAGH